MSESSGIGVYLRHLVPLLAGGYRERFALTLLGGGKVAGVARQLAFRAPLYSLREQFEAPLRVPVGTDALWCPNYNAPMISRGRLVVTVHDLCHLALPELLQSRLKERYARLLFANVRRRADRVICVSEFTAVELTRLTGIERDRIVVIQSGIDTKWYTPTASRRPLPEPYILYVGNVKPHKNVTRLLEAFESLRTRIPHRLVVVGKLEGLRTPDTTVASVARRLGERVLFTGEVTDEALRAYYAHADLLAHPSLYEGFGFTPLEAMAIGLPVAASRAASIPEVCGDAVAYFDPYSVDDMSSVIVRTLEDQALRDSLRARGRAQAARYSWSRAAGQMADVLSDVAA